MSNPKASTSISKWYQTERNTEALVKAVMKHRSTPTLSGDDIWWLIRLTWITASRGKLIELHWQRLKVPALAHLLKKRVVVSDDLEQTLSSMRLPTNVARAASKRTGMVNAYNAYRNSLRKWSNTHRTLLLGVITQARTLKANDQARFELAHRISDLPMVPSPSGTKQMPAAKLITPLVACLDPHLRFPIVNGETGVTRRLVKLGLSNRSLVEQVQGFLGIIGQFGIHDAFALDTMDEDLVDRIINRQVRGMKSTKLKSSGSALPNLDGSERTAIMKAQTIQYRRRHNTMTTGLKALLPRLQLMQGARQECRYDVLILDYDQTGRNLLIEAKPDPDAGSIRVALGQLFDYRRFLTHQVGTDLAILTIGRPAQDYIKLLQDLHVTPLWFLDDKCRVLAGKGHSWAALKARLKS